MTVSTPMLVRPYVWLLPALLLLPAPAATQVAGVPLQVDVQTPSGEEGGAAPAAAPRRVATFLERQLRYPRVRDAWERKAERVEATLEARGVEDVGEVFFRVFKEERELEVWAREPGAAAFTYVRTYPVCAISGELGPKRREGDRQIPEGFYRIDLFNPWSDYHLSMRVSYPNPVDRVRGQRSPGGDIYIHGGCSTIGCVPVTDEYIEELYVIAAEARSAGQRTIPVHIFPTRMDVGGMIWLADTHGTDHVDYRFWENLREGYQLFEWTRRLPDIGADGGRYTFDYPLPASALRLAHSSPWLWVVPSPIDFRPSRALAGTAIR